MSGRVACSAAASPPSSSTVSEINLACLGSIENSSTNSGYTALNHEQTFALKTSPARFLPLSLFINRRLFYAYLPSHGNSVSARIYFSARCGVNINKCTCRILISFVLELLPI